MGKISSAVILAAGYSTRLGQPKALVMWNEETLIERSIRLLEDAGIKKIVVVTNKELMAAFIPLVGNHSIVVNPSPENGRTGSLQIGIKSILSNFPNIPRAILVVPVDRCGWESGTVQALLSQKTNSKPIPSGHPLLLFDIAKVMMAPKDMPLRDIVTISEVSAPGRYLNIDTPEDLEALND